jgi:hypothetical protein
VAEHSYLTLTPLREWTLTGAYGHYQNNLKTDVIYGTDPFFYPELLVPFKALSQSYTVASDLLLKKKPAWRVEG